MTAEQASGDTTVPPLPPEEYFSHPLFAKFARTYWDNPDLPSLAAAVRMTASDLTAAELLTVPMLVEQAEDRINHYMDFDREDDAQNTFRRWLPYKPATFEVDETGVISGVIGTLQGMRELVADPRASVLLAYALPSVLEDAARQDGSYEDATRYNLIEYLGDWTNP